MKLSILFTLFAMACVSPSWTMASDVTQVSLVQLIANPEKYQNKTVAVFGYIHVGFEDSALFLSEEHSKYGDTKSAIWVSYAEASEFSISYNDNGISRTSDKPMEDLKRFDRTWVGLMGKFSFEKLGDGHMGMFAGDIEVTKLVSHLPIDTIEKKDNQSAHTTPAIAPR
ncbi:hypothetical protein [Pelagicoccus sp. SDUM812003]|uniref:hypothetical protein n=1 Tax=Pelagicoccus sp. SDUM812003 TaxID=3041267 RepID=UPI00281045F6|nr:hypothetical protein [Pelagicoccus sp. SDUM812003]MDQ8205790.1 hypothetical protein [Pelagicoccus sp. SDUM812003]